MRFDLTTLYSLLQAFDLTGRRIFGAAWAGDEAFARRKEDPQAVREQRDAMTSQILTLTSQKQPHYALLAVSAGDEVHKSAASSLYDIEREMDSLKADLSALPLVTDWWIADFETFQRRIRVETELRNAFDRQELDLQVGQSDLVQWRSWSRLSDFKVYFGLSMVRVPFAHAGERRRGPAFVSKVALEHWLERFAPNEASPGTLTPMARLKTWLEDKIRRHQPKEFSKQTYLDDAKREIPGLTIRTFNTVWSHTVPDSWKKSGRKPRL